MKPCTNILFFIREEINVRLSQTPLYLEGVWAKNKLINKKKWNYLLNQCSPTPKRKINALIEIKIKLRACGIAVHGPSVHMSYWPLSTENPKVVKSICDVILSLNL